MLSAGNVTLDAQGNANAVFIFQIGSTLTTMGSTQVILAGGAQAKNIFWEVGSSATLGTNSIFEGTIISLQSITLDTGATLDWAGAGAECRGHIGQQYGYRPVRVSRARAVREAPWAQLAAAGKTTPRFAGRTGEAAVPT